MRNKKKKGKEGYAAVKLGMSKAYDRVEWQFVHGMMMKLVFNTRWIDLIMKCISSVSYRIKVNGELSKSFRLRRGQRQGDPLFAYLFLICAEGFYAFLQKAEDEVQLRCVKIYHNTLSVCTILANLVLRKWWRCTTATMYPKYQWVFMTDDQ